MALHTPSSSSSNSWNDVANTTAGRTTTSQIFPEEICQELPLYLNFAEIECTFPVPDCDISTLKRQQVAFLDCLHSKDHSDERRPQSSVTLGLQFIQFLFDNKVSIDDIKSVLRSFTQQFLCLTDIHTIVTEISDSLQVKKQALRTYYAARSLSLTSLEPVESALISAAEEGSASIYAVFGGHGANNTKCVAKLRDLNFQFQPLLADLIDVVNPLLQRLSRLPQTREYYRPRYLDLTNWLEEIETVPDQESLAAAAFSFPIIGLISLARFHVMCRILNKSPGQLRSCFRGITGHSQGIIVASAIAESGSWESFYENAKIAVETLFWIGFESEQVAPRCSLSATAIADSLDHGEGRPASMLSVRNLSQSQVEAVVEKCNCGLAVGKKVYIGLINSRDDFVISGPADTLHGLNLHLRDIKADPAQDQSRIRFSRRKPVIDHQFLAINAPLHSPHLKEAAEKIMFHVADKTFVKGDKPTPVYHTENGLDVFEQETGGVISNLVKAITVDIVDWPAASKFPHASHIIAFDADVGALMAKNQEGQGVRVIMASEMETQINGAGCQAELFTRHLPDPVLKPKSWVDAFLPRPAKLNNGQWLLNTKMSRLLGTPPIMVAGMTPTTVPWDFVAAIMNAGYHAELAGGGYHDSGSMSTAIRKLAENIPTGRGITCNLIYVSPKALAWQIPMVGQLIREGVPIDGLTIGAGVPSTDIAAEYIMSLGLKHISFKPGSISAIRQVVSIAESHPSFPVILQWTGGRGGGHHSFEDFHQPLLETYAEIRRVSNVILIVGSGFGGAEDTYPYLTGTWAHQFGRCLMPVDGILLGSRMMVAKEARTSPQSKKLIVEATGSTEWERSYDGEVGGVMTVQSEMGQPIHKIATRGVRLWADMDKRIFSLPRDKRVAELQKNRAWILQRLNDDFAKPWFGKSSSGALVDMSEMTYAEILTRLVDLMYVTHQKRWIDESYLQLVFDVAWRMAERLSYEDIDISTLKDPYSFLDSFFATRPHARTLLIHPEDASWVIRRCKQRSQKPVNFVPVLDEDFEVFFKKDSLWQCEDVDAVVNEDAGRVCILQGPTSARYSLRQDEPAKDILDAICLQHISMIHKLESEKGDLHSELSETFKGHIDSDLHKDDSIRGVHSRTLSPNESNWIDTLLSEDHVYQGNSRVTNPLRRLFQSQSRTAMLNEEEYSQVRLINGLNDCKESQARIRCFKNSKVSVDLYHPGHDDNNPAMISFRFGYSADGWHRCLREEMEQRNHRIKSYYRKIWLGSDLTKSERLDSIFDGEEIMLTREMLHNAVSTVGEAYADNEMTKSVSANFPMDYCIVVLWDVIVRPLLVEDFDCDLLKIVHRSNTFEYARGALPLQIGDKVSARSRVEAVTIEPAGKSLIVKADIKRTGETIATVISTFLCKGTFTDFNTTFKYSEPPVMKLLIESAQDEALLRDRKWFHLDQTYTSLVGKCLLFRLRTRLTYDDHGGKDQIQTNGVVFEHQLDGAERKVGDVDLLACGSRGNPVTDYLERKGQPAANRVDLEKPGWTGQSSLDVTMPSSNESYARLSGDCNPIHVSQIFADWAGLPGIISHGMLTSAVARGAIEHLVGDGQRTRFRRWSTSFVGIVFPGDRLTVSFQHTAMLLGRMVLQVSVHRLGTTEKVLEGEAELEQEETAYVFTGQGSQSADMGMALYNSSPVARRIWDEADDMLKDAYGWSIKEIVRNNPKTFTVRFGGKRGRQIRENYLAMKVDDTLPDGRTVSVPILKALNDRSESYTFSDPRGLIFSTQFAQPAIVLVEKASFEDMRSKGLVQEQAMYGGHSLGEYGSLSALADFMPLGALIKLLFYRGLAMQVAMEIDEDGRTEYAMVAVNPVRVGKFFDETALRQVTRMIMQESQSLLEIVNLNVEGEQYVCAGHLRAIAALGSLLNHLATTPHAAETVASPNDLQTLVENHVSSCADLPMPIELKQGKATLPLKGIDVPFHSSHLHPSVPPYRDYLQQQISKESLQVDKLVGRYIPNLIGKPFSIQTEYLREVWKLTGSEILRELVEPAVG